MQIQIVSTLLLLLTQATFQIEKHVQGKIPLKSDPPAPEFPEFKELYATNLHDHFDATNESTYNQRYFVSDKYWDKKSGPIFVYICGEYTCSVPATRMFPYAMAEEHNALFFIVEHRFYGKSQLFEDWSLPNLKLLQAEQALADLAYFIQSRQAEISQEQGTSERRKVVTIGGSYPGALSAWFRYKYPHVTDGSLSSSGVIRPLLNFPEFDKQIAHSMSLTPGCIEMGGHLISIIKMNMESSDDNDR